MFDDVFGKMKMTEQNIGIREKLLERIESR